MGKSFELIVLFLAALATGALIINWIGLGRAMSRLSVSAYIEFHQHTNHTFDPYMPVVAIGAPVGGFALAVMCGVHSLAGQLFVAGAVCYVLVLVIGVPTCVRINKQIADWSVQDPPHEWAQTRARWLRFHMIRTLFSLPGLAFYLLAAMAHAGHQ
jgi:uncharacterized membrane protein